jgi:PHD/YefM family antitoxin component YafN of YafNO toxin-antitoxin module
MGINAQLIKKNGKKEFVILPYTEFLQMQQTIEDYEDLVDLRKAKAETMNEPSIPYNEIAEKINQTTKKLKARTNRVKR